MWDLPHLQPTIWQSPFVPIICAFCLLDKDEALYIFLIIVVEKEGGKGTFKEEWCVHPKKKSSSFGFLSHS
jgi:hypothetical protein